MKLYQIKAFSRLTGLSIRSLQYYDTLGLLKPSHKSTKGYRHYAEVDFLRLQQILALKLQGLSLKAIHAHLSTSPLDEANTLALLDQVLTQRLSKLREAQTLTQMEHQRAVKGEQPDTARLGKILQLMLRETVG